MNQLLTQNTQPHFFNMTQTPPNVYPNGNSTFHSHISIIRPQYGNEGFSQLLNWLIDFLKKLEQDRNKMYPKPTVAILQPFMNPDFVFALNQISPFSYFIDLFYSFEVNPYLEVFQRLAVENRRLVESPQTTPSHIWENAFRRLRGELYTAKAKLLENKYKAQVQKLRNEQKNVFRRVMQAHDQANCIFLELPLITQTDPSHYQTQEEAEKNSVKVLKNYFQWLHSAKMLSEKLYNIQWRIVKGLDHKLTVQAFIYILGDEIDYLPLLEEQWELTCLEFHLQNVFPIPKHTHCYDGQGIVQKIWLKLIERLHEPLGFYRYKGNSITYAWKTYIGNV
ncbi:hypothetical protein [Acinetobacter bereziniae]|uniref:hypothetical protein n=1 Tax=Acinetobacter bereziniae TaxID=106648 RepID=UPI0019023301|nr:hypothetical protein [Acinetobacter bereziniae]MBJ9903910.1 hypothetical protein [Acinetobacter bereziniae]